MENANFWNDPNDYSLSVPGEGFDLLWDPNSDFDWNSLGDTGLDFALNDVSLPVLDYCSTSQNYESTPEFALTNRSDDRGLILPPSDNDAQHSSLLGQESNLDHCSQTISPHIANHESPSSAISEKELMKRKISESVVVFSATSNMEVKPRKRRAFSKLRKGEVALNRLIGACIQCRIRKGPCSSDMPCQHCVNRAGNIKLGEQICTRQSLVTARFDRLGTRAFQVSNPPKTDEEVDLFRVSVLRSKVQQVRANRDITPAGHMYLGYPPALSKAGHSSLKSFIKLPLVKFSWASDPGVHLVISYDYYDCRSIEIRPNPLAIAFESLPSIDMLFEVYNTSAQVPNRGPFRGVNVAFKEFAEYYRKTVADLPLKSLLHKALRLQTLFAMYTKGLVMKEHPDSKEFFHASISISAQLSYIISKEIVSTEVAVLAEVDKLVYGPDGIGRRNPLVLWVCLWTLIMSYKHQMVFADAFFSGDDYYNLATHVYNSLTAIYAALYRTTSPLTFDWRSSEIAEIMGNDPALVRLFCNIKTEMFWFHANSDRLYKEDALFKSLVIENESKLVQAHIKAAKKKGIL